MQNFYMALIGGFVSIIGTLSGGLIGMRLKNPTKNFMSFAFSFCGGLMLGVVVFDLIPSSLKTQPLSTIIFSVAGCIFMMLVDKYIEEGDSFNKTAIMTAIALVIHNLPEGILMGYGFATGDKLGMEMCIIIAIHDIPEGLAVALPLVAGHSNNLKIIKYIILVSIPTMIGALIGFKMKQSVPYVSEICLSLASGIMLYVVCGEMIPKSNELKEGKISAIGLLTGIFLSLIIINVI